MNIGDKSPQARETKFEAIHNATNNVEEAIDRLTSTLHELTGEPVNHPEEPTSCNNFVSIYNRTPERLNILASTINSINSDLRSLLF